MTPSMETWAPTMIFRMIARLRASSLPVDLDVLLAPAIRDRDHDPDADQDHDSDHGPERRDAGQEAELPERGNDATHQQNETYEIHSGPLHGKPPRGVKA